MTKATPSGGRAAELALRQAWRPGVLVGLATLANYVGWLGWDRTKHLGPDGYLHGPYEPWQVVGVVLVLAAIAAVAGWRRHLWDAAIVTTLVMTVCFSVTATTEPRSDGLWPIGAFGVAVGTFLGVGLVALVADVLRGGKHPGQPMPDWHRGPWVWVVMAAMALLILLLLL